MLIHLLIDLFSNFTLSLIFFTELENDKNKIELCQQMHHFHISFIHTFTF